MIDQTQLKKLLHYDPVNGVFTWLKRIAVRITPGDRAGNLHNKHRYRIIGINGRKYKAARLAQLYMTGHWPEGQMDHINHVRDDDRFENLRVVDHIGNMRNHPRSKANTSGFTGLSWGKRDQLWVGYCGSFERQFKQKSSALAWRTMMAQAFNFHPNHGAVS